MKNPEPEEFRGFGRDALGVFRKLEQSNNRDTFLALKPDYERLLKAPAMSLVAALNHELAARKVPLRGDPKRALFRPNRDTRFARDKSPYKTNIGFVMSRTGGKNDPGLLYFHLGVDSVFTAFGFYMPEPGDLFALRTRIVTKPKEWRAVQLSLAANGLALSREQQAKRLPPGIARDVPEDIRDDVLLKSFVVSRPLTQKDVRSPDLVTTIADFAAQGRGLLQFGWKALAAASATTPARRR